MINESTNLASGNTYDAELRFPPPVVLGPRLEAGSTYLLTLALTRDVSPTTIEAALVAIGFSNVIHDASLNDPGSLTESTWGLDASPAKLLRFLASVTSTVHLTDGPLLTWVAAERVRLDVRANLSEEARLEPHDLAPGGVYEVRFLSRMRSETAGKRAAVLKSLCETMGFDVLTLTSLKRDMRMPGRPNASDELWYAIVRWPTGRGASVLTIDDPFFFYDVLHVNPEAREPEHPLESGSLDEDERAAVELAIATDEAEASRAPPFSNADEIPPEA